MTELLVHSAVCMQCCVWRQRLAEQCHALAQVKLLYNLCEWRLENDMEFREHARRAVRASQGHHLTSYPPHSPLRSMAQP